MGCNPPTPGKRNSSGNSSTYSVTLLRHPSPWTPSPLQYLIEAVGCKLQVNLEAWLLFLTPLPSSRSEYIYYSDAPKWKPWLILMMKVSLSAYLLLNILTACLTIHKSSLTLYSLFSFLHLLPANSNFPCPFLIFNASLRFRIAVKAPKFHLICNLD